MARFTYIPAISSRSRSSQGLRALANALCYQGDLPAALTSIQEAHALADKTIYSDETQRMISMSGVLAAEGRILGEEGGVNLNQPEKAIKAFQAGVDLAEEIARKDPKDATSRIRVGDDATQLGNVLRDRDPERALAAYDLAVRRLGEVPNDLRSRQDQALALANSSYALRHLHRSLEAKERIDKALTILKQTKDLPLERVELNNSPVYFALTAQADYEAQMGDIHRAVQMYEHLLDKVMTGKPELLNDLPDAPALSRLYGSLAVLYSRIGDNAKADEMRSRRLELWREWDRKLPKNAFILRQLNVQ